MANVWGADYFISIHCNAGTKTAKGTETLIYAKGGNSEKLAELVNSNLVNLGLTNRGVKVRTDLGVLKNTNMSAILIETAFITNANDAEFLRFKQDDIAHAIGSAILKYLGVNMEDKITTVEQALDKIISKGVDTDKDFWIKACDYDTYLDKLLIKIANVM